METQRAKKYFKIGEIARELEVEPHVLRYWETEFDQLTPHKTRSGQRSYDQADLELLKAIRWLLYDEMYTIAGARNQLARMKEAGRGYGPMSLLEPTQQNLLLSSEQEKRIHELEQELQALRSMSTEIESLRDMLEQTELENEVLSAQLRDAEANVGAGGDVEAMGAEIDALRDVISKLRSSQESMTEEKGWLEAENNRLQSIANQRRQHRRGAIVGVRKELERLKEMCA